MAYSAGTSAPMPPPPPNGAGPAAAFSNAYGLHQNAIDRTAQFGVAPVDQMTNIFGGRQPGADPAVVQRNQPSGGNRVNQHVVTPGNNNVSYGASQSGANNTLWQQSSQSQAGVAPANGLSHGFMKNTQARPSQAPPPPAPPPTTGPVPGGVLGGPTSAVQEANRRANEIDMEQVRVANLPVAPPAARAAAGTPTATTGGVVMQQPGAPAPPPVAAPTQNWTLSQAIDAWNRNNMGPRTYTVGGQLRRTAEWSAFLQKHGVG